MIHGYLTAPNCVINNVSKTTFFFERMRGLLGTRELGDRSLLIAPCSSVHTFAMHYAIDLVFIDKHWRVIKTVNSLKPWRMAAARNAAMVLELAAKRLQELPLNIGQQLEWHEHA